MPPPAAKLKNPQSAIRNPQFPLANPHPSAYFYPPCLSISPPSIFRLCRPASLSCGGIFDVPKLQARLAELEEAMAAPDFWNNKERAQTSVEEISTLRGKINPLLALERQVDDLGILKELALGETDPDSRAAAAQEVLNENADALKEPRGHRAPQPARRRV